MKVTPPTREINSLYHGRPSTDSDRAAGARCSCIRFCLQPYFKTTCEVCQSLDSASLAEGGWSRTRRLDRAAAVTYNWFLARLRRTNRRVRLCRGRGKWRCK